MSEVVQLPVPERSCVECIHYEATERDTRCGLYQERIFSEKIAAFGCEGYEVES